MAEQRCSLHVVEVGVECGHVADSGDVGEPVGKGRSIGSPDGHRVLVPVEHQPAFADLAVEMDRQLRDACERCRDVEQGFGAVCRHNSSGESEVAVEPRVEQHTAVDLDPQLCPSVRDDVRVRLHTQVR